MGKTAKPAAATTSTTTTSVNISMPEVVRDMMKQIEPLARSVQAGGNPEEIRPRMLKICKDHERRIEAILTEGQRSRWKEMLGPRVSL